MPGSQRPEWRPLLFRQICLLAAVCGMLFSRFPLEGALAVLLLALFALPSLTPERSRAVLFLFFFSVGAAFGWGTEQAPLKEDAIPGWVKAAVTPLGKESDPRFSQGVSLSGAIRENTRLSGGRSRLILEDVRAEGERGPLPGLLTLTWQHPPPDIAAAGPGHILTATVRLREIRGFANPGVWETEQYWRDNGAFFRAWTRGDATRNGKTAPYRLEGETSTAWSLRETIRRRVLTALADPDAPEGALRLSQPAAIIPALLFGDRSFCAPEMLDLVARATLAHSLALSGMHLGFAAGIGYSVAYLLGFLFPGLLLRLPLQKAGILPAVPLAALYLWLGGAPPSLVRAALMLLFWAVLLWLNKPKVLLDGLIWAVAVILLFSPSALYDIRLQLSAVSVAGIALATPLLRYAGQSIRERDRFLGTRRGGPVRHLLYAMTGMAGISVAAQVAVLPLVVNAFPGTGFWFPLNLIWLPVLGIWVMPLSFAGLFAASIGLSGAAASIFHLAEFPCAVLLSLLQGMDAWGVLIAPVMLRPAWPAIAGYWLLLLLIPVICMARRFSGRTPLLLAVGLALVSGPSVAAFLDKREDMVRMQLIDVGQGQSVLVSWQGKTGDGRMLVDGGGFASGTFDVGRQVIAPVLTANAAPDLDWVVNSHPDADHLQGLLFPLASFRVANVAFGPEPDAKSTKTFARRDEILRKRGITPVLWQAGDVVPLAPGLVVEVLHPGENAANLSANDGALVLRLVKDGKPLALICGDVERQGIRQILNRGAALEADVLVLPHHGSAGSFEPDLYDAVRPKLALAACGYANTWHFPAAKVREALAERSVPLATTADKGQITVVWKNGTMDVRYARRGPGERKTP